MKKCSKCQEEKQLSEFNKNSAKRDGLQEGCRSCTRLLSSEWYRTNSSDKKKTAKVRRDKVLAENRAFILSYLKDHPCVDCGESRLACLDFDHVRGIKFKEISLMMQYALEKLKAEIEKCDVRCANCHRIKTAKDFNWYSHEA